MSVRAGTTPPVGFALPSMIIALVLLSALIVGVLFVATEELRAGRSDVAEQRALAAAESAVEDAVRAWSPQGNTALAIGTTTVIDARSTSDGELDVTLTRVQRRSVWVVARATSRDGRAIPARRAIGASLRLVGPDVPVRAALMAGGAVGVHDGGTVDGRDAASLEPHARLCADHAPSDVAGVAVPDSTRVCGAECTGEIPAGIVGAPAVASVPSLATDSAFTDFGDETRASLSARATYVLPEGRIVAGPLVSAGTCDVTSAFNWGDPSGATPCLHHFPVVWVRGNAVLAAGSVGQGVLLVDGDLTLEPGARFVGMVAVGDDLTVRGAGAELVGVALARDIDATGGSSVVDGGAVRFASCAARVAMLGVSRLTRTPSRWWAELR